jgi:hypothetical protein
VYDVVLSPTDSRVVSKVVWSGVLVNRIAPVAMLVTNDGGLVTFDNHAGAGYEHAIVVYDATGKVLRSHHLDSFLSNDLAERDRSVSSRWWRTSAIYGLAKDILYIRIPGGLVEVTLADGKVTFVRNSPKPIPKTADKIDVKIVELNGPSFTDQQSKGKP